MKKRILKSIVLPVALLSIVLTGCTSAKYKESMATGEKEMQAGKYDTAVTAFSTAVQESPKDETANKKLEEAKQKQTEQEEIKTYLTSIKDMYIQVATLGQKWETLRNQSANGQIDDVTLGTNIVNEIIPENRNLSDNLAKMHAPNEEIRSTQEILITAVDKQLQAFTEVSAAIDASDLSKITSANNLLSEARKADRDFAAKIEPLFKKYSISIQ